MQPADDYDQTKRSIEDLIECPAFERLESLLPRPSLFEVLGISTDEYVHSKMLLWLLDPAELHGLGSEVLRKFLFSAAKLARARKTTFGEHGEPITPLQAQSFAFADVRLRSEYSLENDRRPDLVLWSANERWLCVIENKVLSEEGQEQTTSYYDEIRRSFPPSDFPFRLFVYVTREGQEPESNHFVPVNYTAIARLLDEVGGSASEFGSVAIDQYIKCVRGSIVEPEQEFREICWKLYRRHQPAIDALVRYGSVNLLATETRDLALRRLRSEDGLVSPGRPLEWVTTKGNKAPWIVVLPGHWPRFSVAFRISWAPPKGQSEAIKIDLGFGPPKAAEVKAYIREKHPGLLSRHYSATAKDLVDLHRAAGEASNSLVRLIVDSFPALEEALRSLFPDNRGMITKRGL